MHADWKGAWRRRFRWSRRRFEWCRPCFQDRPRKSWWEWEEEHLLRSHIFAALRNALINGYDLREWTVDAIVTDLLDCDADLEGLDPAQIRPHVRAWLNLNPKGSNHAV